jgi:hypothetical protein
MAGRGYRTVGPDDDAPGGAASDDREADGARGSNGAGEGEGEADNDRDDEAASGSSASGAGEAVVGVSRATRRAVGFAALGGVLFGMDLANWAGASNAPGFLDVFCFQASPGR